MRTSGKYILIATAILSPFVASAAFSDVPSSHPNVNAINYVQQMGIVEGYPDGTYGPSKSINRAEFTKILIGSRYSPVTISSCNSAPFEDVPDDQWFTSYVCVAFNQGIIGGYADGSFKPTNNVNMGEAAKIIVRTFDLPPVPIDDPSLALYRSGFAIAQSQDETLNPYWWQYYLVTLYASGALPSTYRAPDQSVTRGEMADMIYRVMNRQGTASSASSASSVFVPVSSVSSTVVSTSSVSSVVVSSSVSTSSVQSVASSAQSSSVTSQQSIPSVRADLSMEANAPEEVTKGESFVVTYDIYNSGPSDAENVEITGSFMYKSDFDAALSDSRCRALDGYSYNVYCYLGTLNEGRRTSVNIAQKTSRYQCPSTIAQNFQVTTSTGDAAMWDNADTASTLIQCSEAELTDLTAHVTGPSRVQPQTRADIVYSVTNNAEVTAYNVNIRIKIPSGLVFLPTSSPQNCSLQQGGDVLCTLGFIPGMTQTSVDLAFDATCPSNAMSTTMTMTTTSQNKSPLAPSTLEMSCY